MCWGGGFGVFGVSGSWSRRVGRFIALSFAALSGTSAYAESVRRVRGRFTLGKLCRRYKTTRLSSCLVRRSVRGGERCGVGVGGCRWRGG